MTYREAIVSGEKSLGEAGIADAGSKTAGSRGAGISGSLRRAASVRAGTGAA